MSKLKFYILFIIPLLISCNPQNSKYFDEPELTLYNSLFSDGFKIKGYENNNNSLISVFNPWQGAENIVSKVYLARDSVVPKNYEGQVIKGIPKRIVCMSSTHIAMLDALGDVDKVTGVSGMPYI